MVRSVCLTLVSMATWRLHTIWHFTVPVYMADLYAWQALWNTTLPTSIIDKCVTSLTLSPLIEALNYKSSKQWKGWCLSWYQTPARKYIKKNNFSDHLTLCYNHRPCADKIITTLFEPVSESHTWQCFYVHLDHFYRNQNYTLLHPKFGYDAFIYKLYL